MPNPERMRINEKVNSIRMPENVKIGLMIDDHRNNCVSNKCEFDYSALAFGQSPFPVPPSLSHSLSRQTERGKYSSTIGIEPLRSAISEFHNHYFGLNTDMDDVIIGNGTSDIFFLIFSLIEGGAIIPSPSWVSYVPQLQLLGKDYHIYHTRAENGYKVDAEGLDDMLTDLERRQHILILNSPNNPTGAVYTRKELEAIADVCSKHGALILSDEIYSITTFDRKSFTSMYDILPEATFATNGLSKCFSAGGYRLGWSLLPTSFHDDVMLAFKKIATTTYTNVSTPTQYAAAEVIRPNEEMEEYFNITREVHRIMGTNFSNSLNDIDGVKATTPEGGFYTFADLNSHRDSLVRNGVKESNDLMGDMLAHPHHIALISGESCLLEPDDFGARLAYVDYDGGAAYRDFIEDPPQGSRSEEEFFRRCAPRMVDGVERISRYLQEKGGMDNGG